MKVTAEIVAINQKMDFEAGAITHMVEFALPDGSHVTATIKEGDAERLMRLCIGASTEDLPAVDDYAAPPVPQVQQFSSVGGMQVVETAEGDMVHLFGGTPPPQEPWRKPQVSVDEAGNPVVRGATRSGPPLGEAAGRDEDGVMPA